MNGSKMDEMKATSVGTSFDFHPAKTALPLVTVVAAVCAYA